MNILVAETKINEAEKTITITLQASLKEFKVAAKTASAGASDGAGAKRKRGGDGDGDGDGSSSKKAKTSDAQGGAPKQYHCDRYDPEIEFNKTITAYNKAIRDATAKYPSSQGWTINKEVLLAKKETEEHHIYARYPILSELKTADGNLYLGVKIDGEDKDLAICQTKTDAFLKSKNAKATELAAINEREQAIYNNFPFQRPPREEKILFVPLAQDIYSGVYELYNNGHYIKELEAVASAGASDGGDGSSSKAAKAESAGASGGGSPKARAGASGSGSSSKAAKAAASAGAINGGGAKRKREDGEGDGSRPNAANTASLAQDDSITSAAQAQLAAIQAELANRDAEQKDKKATLSLDDWFLKHLYEKRTPNNPKGRQNPTSSVITQDAFRLLMAVIASTTAMEGGEHTKEEIETKLEDLTIRQYRELSIEKNFKKALNTTPEIAKAFMCYLLNKLTPEERVTHTHFMDSSNINAALLVKYQELNPLIKSLCLVNILNLEAFKDLKIKFAELIQQESESTDFYKKLLQTCVDENILEQELYSSKHIKPFNFDLFTHYMIGGGGSSECKLENSGRWLACEQESRKKGLAVVTRDPQRIATGNNKEVLNYQKNGYPALHPFTTSRRKTEGTEFPTGATASSSASDTAADAAASSSASDTATDAAASSLASDDTAGAAASSSASDTATDAAASSSSSDTATDAAAEINLLEILPPHLQARDVLQQTQYYLESLGEMLTWCNEKQEIMPTSGGAVLEVLNVNAIAPALVAKLTPIIAEESEQYLEALQYLERELNPKMIAISSETKATDIQAVKNIMFSRICMLCIAILDSKLIGIAASSPGSSASYLCSATTIDAKIKLASIKSHIESEGPQGINWTNVLNEFNRLFDQEDLTAVAVKTTLSAISRELKIQRSPLETFADTTAAATATKLAPPSTALPPPTSITATRAGAGAGVEAGAGAGAGAGVEAASGDFQDVVRSQAWLPST